jgi:phosphoribosylanthranilate isomerase
MELPPCLSQLQLFLLISTGGEMNDLPRLKICGIGSESVLSFILKNLDRKVERVLIGLKVGRRYGEIPLDRAQRVIKRFDERFVPVLTGWGDVERIREITSFLGINIVQTDSPANARTLKESGLKVFLRVNTAYGKNPRFDPAVSDFVVVSETHIPPDWACAAGIVERAGRERTYLGGWLHPGNIVYAVKHTISYGIDIDLSLMPYTIGRLSELKRFVEIIENLFTMSVKEEGTWLEWHSL